jgi:type IV pilus assembly protein PilQ
MVFLYKKTSKFKNTINILAVLTVAICAMATIVIARETPASEPQIVSVNNGNSQNSDSPGISNDYIASATSVTQAAAAVQVAAPAAEEQPADESAAEPNAPAQAAEDANTVFIDGALESITFKKDMSVRDALRLLAAKFHKNIVPSMKVDGSIAVTTLYDVTFEDALNAILGNSFKWEQDGNFIRVYAADEYKKIKSDEGRMQHKMFTLYYVTASEAQKLVKPILSSKGKVESSSAAENQISDVDSGGGSGSSAGSSMKAGGGGDKMALHETIVVYDYPENIVKAEEIVSSLDVRPKQVLVEATILSADLTEGMDLGVDLNFLNGVAFTSLADIPSGTPIETTGFASPPGADGLKIGITSGSARAVITALETVTDTTIMANPKILAVNKQEGALQIGKTIGYRDSTTISSGGVATQGEVKFLPTGTVLVFRPYIGDDGYIRMDIFPKDSTAVLNASQVPDEVTTQLKTNVMVKDGETIVLGGLFRDNITTSRSQIPILGDIPLIGWIFRGTSDTSRRQEVIILLTPHIIDSAAQTNPEARVADIERKELGAIRGLQWPQRSRLADDGYAKAVEEYSNGDKTGALCRLNWVLLLRPTYLEALRLKERIVCELCPNDPDAIKRIMLDRIEREDVQCWRR